MSAENKDYDGNKEWNIFVAREYRLYLRKRGGVSGAMSLENFERYLLRGDWSKTYSLFMSGERVDTDRISTPGNFPRPRRRITGDITMEMRRREDAARERELQFLTEEMARDSQNEDYWREMMKRTDPLIDDEMVYSRTRNARYYGPSFSDDERWLRRQRYRDYPPPSVPDHASTYNK